MGLLQLFGKWVADSGDKCRVFVRYIFGYLGQRSAPVRRFVFIWNFTCSAADWNNCDINPICIHANELLSIDEIEYELERPSGRCQRRMKDVVKVPLTILHTFMQIFQLKSTYRIL